MSGQFRENWKRVTGQIKENNPAADAQDLLRVEDGVHGTWNIIASGFVPNDTSLGPVATGVSARLYVVGVWNSQTSGGNMSAGAEAGPCLSYLNAGNAVFGGNPAATNQNDNSYELVEKKASGVSDAATAAASNAMNDMTTVTLDLSDFTFSVAHSDGGDGTNGIYQIWERS